MRKVKNITIIFLLAVGLFNCTAMAKSASTLLQEGLYAEEVEGNLDSAIKIYEQIINDSSAQRQYVAQALYRQGMCYLKKSNEAQAKEVFSKIVNNYSDQSDIVTKVKPLLEEISNADPATLMPPGTLIYAEFGSPGLQIEKILNMLKGTPLENPFAMIAGNQQGAPSGQMNPASMLSALMNPSMMAEFKKIRGIGFGITGIPQQDDPPVIAVLFPGKSDALRGMLHAALGMAGKPVEAIEGMQCLELPGGAGAAFDDNIVILASPKAAKAGQLTWSVKQYKSAIKEPTLATSNKSFAKISKKARQENLLTVWANIEQVYANFSKLFPEGSIPQEISMVDGIVDFRNLNESITTIALTDDGLALETNVSFKDGHSCVAYDTIRTPNLTKAGLEAIPAEAAGIISFALGEAEGIQAQAAGQQIQNMTGLDIGREIFANIEQVTLFALPPVEAPGQAGTAIPPIATRFGVAITSHNPQQTRQMLTRFLNMANLISSQAGGDQPTTETGKYQIALVNGQKVFCYMNQNSKTTVLSLSPDVVEKSVAATDNRKSITSAGPLKAVLDQLSPTTSKLILVNIGGAIKLAAANMDLGDGEISDNAKQLFAQLAEACNQTTVHIRTDEKPNNINVLVSINKLPEMNKVFVPMMQLSQIFEAQKKEQRAQKMKATMPANIAAAASTPVIDGNIDECWNTAQQYELKNSLYDSPESKSDCSASYKALWDKNNLYLLIDVSDDDLRRDSDDFYQDDAVEIFLDPDNSKSDSYGDNDFQYYFRWDKSSPSMGEFADKSNEGIDFKMKTTDSGYVTEIKLPWALLKVQPGPGMTIGLDVHINDDDNGGDRDSKLAWCGKEDNAWQNPGVLGNAQLAGLIGRWDFDGNNGILKDGAVLQADAGLSGGAVTLPTPESYVEIPTTGMSAWSGTIALWLKITGAQDSPEHRYIFGHTTEPHYSNRIQLYMNDGNTMLDVGLGDSHDTKNDIVNLDADKWQQIALTWDNGAYTVYLNGEKVAQGEYSGLEKINPISNIGNNGRSDWRDQSFNGLIDDVRIYNYALSEGEIKALNK